MIFGAQTPKNITMSCTRVCDCNFSMGNTGTDCIPLMQVTKKLMFTPVYDSTGARNYINLATSITASTFTALINQADTSKRLYPLPGMKNVNDTREAPIVETFSDNSTMFIRDNVRKFEGMIVGRDANPILNAAIESARCGEVGVYLVDRLGSLIGMISDDGTKLYPIKLDSGSLAALLVKPTDTTAGKLTVTFNFDPDESDNCLRMVTSSEMGDADLLSLRGLIDVFATYSDITTGGVTVELYTNFGTPINPVLVKGLVVGDFAFYNVTQSSAIAVTGTGAAFSESPDGTYIFEYATADDTTSGDEVRVTPTKNGYDFAAVVANTFDTP